MPKNGVVGIYFEFSNVPDCQLSSIYFRFGHLSEDIFRACRLVVDTGMHALGWTIDMAVDYMMEHSAASRDNIVGEVNRYDDFVDLFCTKS